ncbi:MAG: hypothetical protein ACE5HU_07540 [Acidobacteriota bacterium]
MISGASHFLIMSLFSVLVGVFFGTLTRDNLRDGLKVAGLLSASMVGASLVIAYIMFFLPLSG